MQRRRVVKVIILAGGKGTRLWPMSREKYSNNKNLQITNHIVVTKKILI